MKTLVVAQQKGGVGKTALSLHLAWFLAQKKQKKVLFIDLDTQGNASYTLGTIKKIGGSGNLFYQDTKFEFELEKNDSLVLIPATNNLANIQNIDFNEASTNFFHNMEQIKKLNLFDFCVIDTPPSLGNSLAAALRVADYAICPIELETYSIMGIQMMARTIQNIKKINPNLNFLGLVPSKVDKRNPRQVKHLKDLNVHYNKYLIPCVIGLRSSIAGALSNKTPVWMVRKSAARVAAKEILEFTNYIYSQLN